jgi:hypothetical protein
MGNVYKDFRDDAIEGAVNAAISRLKNGGSKSPGSHDHTKPSLNYQPGTPATIQPPQAAVRRLNVDGTTKK